MRLVGSSKGVLRLTYIAFTLVAILSLMLGLIEWGLR